MLHSGSLAIFFYRLCCLILTIQSSCSISIDPDQRAPIGSSNLTLYLPSLRSISCVLINVFIIFHYTCIKNIIWIKLFIFLQGACLDGVDSITCSCQPGFAGDRCEIDINECETSPCVQAEVCVDLPGDYRCECFSGWTGIKSIIHFYFLAREQRRIQGWRAGRTYTLKCLSMAAPPLK